MSTCSICLDDDPDFKLTICGHTFHESCINQWTAINPICPLCRTVCINTFPYMYKKSLIKKGILTIKHNALIFKHTGFFKSLCKPMYKIIPFSIIKKIEYNQDYFKIIYILNYRPIIKKIYTRNPFALFNLCKYHFYNMNHIY